MPEIRPLYLIVDWDRYFETYESKRTVKSCSWVAMPNRHDGKSYRRITREKNALAVYGAWALIVQVASKCPVRGVLADNDGPLNATDLEDKTGFPEEMFQRALDYLGSDRIRWVQKIEDPSEIAEALREVQEACAPTPRRRPQTSADSAKSPQTPADSTVHPQTPAGLANRPQTPAEFSESPKPAGAPADSRNSPQTPASRGRARADSTQPNPTGQDLTDPSRERASAGACTGTLEETWTYILTLLRISQKKRRPSHEAQAALSRQAEALPLNQDQRDILTWFYELPADERDVDLRSRFRDADRLAINLFTALDRAAAYAKKIGREKKTPAPDPEGWQEWFTQEHPSMPVPASFAGLPDYIRDDYRRTMERRAA